MKTIIEIDELIAVVDAAVAKGYELGYTEATADVLERFDEINIVREYVIPAYMAGIEDAHEHMTRGE